MALNGAKVIVYTLVYLAENHGYAKVIVYPYMSMYNYD